MISSSVETLGLNRQNRVLSQHSPACTLMSAEKGSQEGYMHLTMGMIRAIRNIFSHGDENQHSPEEAYEMLLFINWLFRQRRPYAWGNLNVVSSVVACCLFRGTSLSSSPMTWTPWRFFLVAIAGWMNRQQQEAIAYLRTENRILREKLGQKRILLNVAQKLRQFAEGLNGLEGFDPICLLYWFHQAAPPKLIVTPFMDDKPRGFFATRAPCRPNPIGISPVQSLKIEGDRLHVADLDVLDGTPLPE